MTEDEYNKLVDYNLIIDIKRTKLVIINRRNKNYGKMKVNRMKKNPIFFST